MIYISGYLSTMSHTLLSLHNLFPFWRVLYEDIKSWGSQSQCQGSNVIFQLFAGMGQNYLGQAMNMGNAYQQQGMNLMNQGRQMSQQMAGQVPSPQQQWQQLLSMGQNLQQQGAQLQSQGEAIKKQGEEAAGGGAV